VNALNRVTLTGSIIRTPTLIRNGSFDVLLGTIGVKSTVNGRPTTSYVPFRILGKAATALEGRLTAETTVSFQGVAKQNAKTKKTDIQVLRAEILGNLELGAPDKAGNRLPVNGTNTATIGGNLVSDISVGTVKVAGVDTSVAKFRVALNERFKTQDGQTKTRVMYLNVVAWRELAESLSGFKKGEGVIVEGAVLYQTRPNDQVPGSWHESMRFQATGVQRVVKPISA